MKGAKTHGEGYKADEQEQERRPPLRNPTDLLTARRGRTEDETSGRPDEEGQTPDEDQEEEGGDGRRQRGVAGFRQQGRGDEDVWFSKVVDGGEVRMLFMFLSSIEAAGLTGITWYQQASNWARTTPANITITVRRTGRRLRHVDTTPPNGTVADEDVLDIAYLDNTPALLYPQLPPPKAKGGDDRGPDDPGEGG